MHDLAQELKEGNAEAVWLQLESRGWLSNASDASEQRLWLAWLRCAGCWYLDRLFAVFFWFFFLGPVGAVFYRWVVLYNQHPQVINKHLPSAAQWQHALEWLPVRYMGLCACLAGNFTTGIRAWQQSVLNLSITSADFLAHCLGAALLADSTVSTSSQEADSELQQTLARSPALEELMVRTEIIGLVGISVAILVLR
jgi:membrane protein required for beta-lactamase induction